MGWLVTTPIVSHEIRFIKCGKKDCHIRFLKVAEISAFGIDNYVVCVAILEWGDEDFLSFSELVAL